MKRSILISLATVSLLGACVHNSDPIGTAFMEEDGTIILDLIARDRGAIGHARLRHPKDHPEYQSILDHLGGLSPGEKKLVPPYRRR